MPKVSPRRGLCRRCGGPKEIKVGLQFCDDCRSRKTDPVLTAKRKADKERRDAAPEGEKWCARCDHHLPLAQFAVNPSGRVASYCFPCTKEFLHENRLQRIYGITAVEYKRLLDLQGGRCAVCRCKPRTMRLAVDHNHKTNEIRGLLCSRCNHKVIGAAKEDPAILRRAASYLEAPPAEVGTVDHLDEGVALEVEDGLRQATDAADGRLPFVAFRPNGMGEHPEDFIAFLRLSDLVSLLRGAGYGTTDALPIATEETA